MWVSIGLGTRGDDVSALPRALRLLISDGPSWTNEAVDGYISPSPDPRPAAEHALANRGL